MIMKARDECLDVLIHNAGHVSYDVAEAFTPGQFFELFDICCVSTQRINRVALPHMRRAGKGLLVWLSSSSARGPNSLFLAPYFGAMAAMDSLAQSYAGELSRWGIETTIVVPSIFTKGTNHFALSRKPADEHVVGEYIEGGPYSGYDNKVMQGSAALAPKNEDPQDVARAVVDVVNAPFGKRPFRADVEPSKDGADEVSAVADRVRAEFMRRIGCEDWLVPVARSAAA